MSFDSMDTDIESVPKVVHAEASLSALIPVVYGETIADGYMGYYNYFSHMFQNEQFRTFIGIVDVARCVECKRSSPCFTLASDSLEKYAKEFAETLLVRRKENQFQNSENLAEHYTLVCPTCQCLLYQYDERLPPHQQAIHTLTIKWQQNEGRCRSLRNIETICCQACKLLYESCGHELQQLTMRYFGTHCYSKRCNTELAHIPLYFPTVEDVPGIRTSNKDLKYKFGNKNRFALTWIQQRGLVTYPIPGNFQDTQWRSQLQQDHQILFKTPLKFPKDDEDEQDMDDDDDEQKDDHDVEQKVTSLVLPAAPSNHSTRLRNVVPTRPNYKSRDAPMDNSAGTVSQEQKLKQAKIERQQILRQLHYTELAPDSYVTFYVPIDPRPKSKSLNSWCLTARDPTKPLSADNYLITTVFCSILETRFGLERFLHWATDVFVSRYHVHSSQQAINPQVIQSFDEYFQARLQLFDPAIFVSPEENMAMDPAAFSTAVDTLTGTLQQSEEAQNAVSKLHEITNQTDALKQQLEQLQLQSKAIQQQIAVHEEEKKSLTPILLSIREYLEEHPAGSAVLKEMDLKIEQKMKITNGIKKLSQLSHAEQLGFVLHILQNAKVLNENINPTLAAFAIQDIVNAYAGVDSPALQELHRRYPTVQRQEITIGRASTANKRKGSNLSQKEKAMQKQIRAGYNNLPSIQLTTEMKSNADVDLN